MCGGYTTRGNLSGVKYKKETHTRETSRYGWYSRGRSRFLYSMGCVMRNQSVENTPFYFVTCLCLAPRGVKAGRSSDLMAVVVLGMRGVLCIFPPFFLLFYIIELKRIMCKDLRHVMPSQHISYNHPFCRRATYSRIRNRFCLLASHFHFHFHFHFQLSTFALSVRLKG